LKEKEREHRKEGAAGQWPKESGGFFLPCESDLGANQRVVTTLVDSKSAQLGARPQAWPFNTHDQKVATYILKNSSLSFVGKKVRQKRSSEDGAE